MSLWFSNQWYWWPALLRLLIFSMMTAGGALMGQLGDKSTSSFSAYGWAEWTKFWMPVALAWFGVWLAFLDQTLAKLKHEADGGGTVWTKGESI